MNHTLSISIVTFNNVTEISNLLDPIISFSDVDIFIIDNNSTDGTVEYISSKYPQVHVISNIKNIGFGAAHNKIIEHLTSEFHIFVNPDIVITNKTLIDVISFMKTHESVVAMSPKVKNFDNTEQFLPKKAPTIRYMIGGRLEYISTKFSFWRDKYTLKNQKIMDCMDVDFCTGCFFVTRTHCLRELKGFDERYFLYFEDADLTRRLQNLGRTIYNPHIEVLHEWKRDSSKSYKLFMISLKSMIRYFNKWGWKF